MLIVRLCVCEGLLAPTPPSTNVLYYYISSPSLLLDASVGRFVST